MVLETPNCLKGLGALSAAMFLGWYITLIKAQVLCSHLWVVAADMFIQVSLAGKGEGAVATGVDGGIGQCCALAMGSVARVAFLMAFQARRLREGLKAQCATVGPLFGMDGAFMSPQVAQTAEIEFAARAAMRSIALLNAVMAFQKMEVAEGS